jgi:hypothetical protein
MANECMAIVMNYPLSLRHKFNEFVPVILATNDPAWGRLT